MKLHAVRAFRSLMCLAVAVTPQVSLLAQGGGRTGSELDLLRNEDLLEEIGVSSEVIEQMEELRRNTTTT